MSEASNSGGGDSVKFMYPEGYYDSGGAGISYPKAPYCKESASLYSGKIRVPDPYQWMEDCDGDDTQSWVKAQQGVTDAYFDGDYPKSARPAGEVKESDDSITDMVSHIHNTMQGQIDYTRYGEPFFRGPYRLQWINKGKDDHATLYIAKAVLSEGGGYQWGDFSVLLNPNAMSDDGSVSVSTVSISASGKYMAYKVNQSGSDNSTIKIDRILFGCQEDSSQVSKTMTLSGKDGEEETVEFVKYSCLSWLPDESGFLYCRFPEENNVQACENHQVFYHRLGTAQSADKLVYQDKSHPKFLFSGRMTVSPLARAARKLLLRSWCHNQSVLTEQLSTTHKWAVAPAGGNETDEKNQTIRFTEESTVTPPPFVFFQTLDAIHRHLGGETEKVEDGFPPSVRRLLYHHVFAMLCVSFSCDPKEKVYLIRGTEFHDWLHSEGDNSFPDKQIHREIDSFDAEFGYINTLFQYTAPKQGSGVKSSGKTQADAAFPTLGDDVIEAVAELKHNFLKSTVHPVHLFKTNLRAQKYRIIAGLFGRYDDSSAQVDAVQKAGWVAEESSGGPVVHVRGSSQESKQNATGQVFWYEVFGEQEYVLNSASYLSSPSTTANGNPYDTGVFSQRKLGALLTKYAVWAVDEIHWLQLAPAYTTASAAELTAIEKTIAKDAKPTDTRVYDGQVHFGLPAPGTVVGFNTDSANRRLYYKFTSYLYPGTVIRLNLNELFELEGKFHQKIYESCVPNFDAGKCVTKQIVYKSFDGTEVRMSITYKGVDENEDVKDCAFPRFGDKPRVCILYGYGGFNIALSPYFSTVILPWLDAGGVYCVANLRGGGEGGDSWHEQGTKLRKQNVFDDFISAALYLTEQKLTTPDLLCIEGGSNGGLLVAAVCNQRPELFRCVCAQVGVLDMLKFHRFTIGHHWCSDYGCAEVLNEKKSKETDDSESKVLRMTADMKHFSNLYSYSPYHNIATVHHEDDKVYTSKVYPSVLVTTADHDDRVVPAHSFKFTARLQATVGRAVNQGNPLLIQIQSKAGHGAGKPLKQILKERSQKYAFYMYECGWKLPKDD